MCCVIRLDFEHLQHVICRWSLQLLIAKQLTYSLMMYIIYTSLSHHDRPLVVTKVTCLFFFPCYFLQQLLKKLSSTLRPLFEPSQRRIHCSLISEPLWYLQLYLALTLQHCSVTLFDLPSLSVLFHGQIRCGRVVQCSRSCNVFLMENREQMHMVVSLELHVFGTYSRLLQSKIQSCGMLPQQLVSKYQINKAPQILDKLLAVVNT